MASGDRAAFAELYDRFSRPLFATAARILSDPREAEDIVHDVFIVLWEKASEFNDTRGTAFGWAVTLTRNRAIDRIRQRRRRQELLTESAPSDLAAFAVVRGRKPVDDLQTKEEAATVRQAV